MKLVRVEYLFGEELARSDVQLAQCLTEVREAVARVTWPPDSESFRIRPVPKGNGVTPIKRDFQQHLAGRGWELERLPTPGSAVQRRAGPLDALRKLPDGRQVAAEWETGNISSSHRALNKLTLALLDGDLAAGVLVLPSGNLYRYLTDRIGSYPELEPYFRLWRRAPIPGTCLAVFAVEHDSLDETVPLIPKGRDGNADK